MLGRRRGRPASHDPEPAKNIFASEEALRPLSVKKQNRRGSMSPGGFAMLAPRMGQHPMPTTLSLSHDAATKLAVKLNAGAAG